MKIKSLLLVCLFFAALTDSYSQKIKEMTVNMYDSDCLLVIDGLISDASEQIPMEQLAHFEQAASQERLTKLGLRESECVMVRSSADLEIENHIFRQVHAQVQQIGTKYKMPIAVNGVLIPAYAERRSQLEKIESQQIKNIRFLNKAEAQAKYGGKIVFGLVEITV